MERLTKQEITALILKEKQTAFEALVNHQKQIQNLQNDFLENKALSAGYSLQIKQINKALKAQEKTLQRKEEDLQEKEKAVENLTKALARKENDIAYYKDQIALLQRLLYGQKREKFQGTPDGIQMTLPLKPEAEQKETNEQEVKQKIEYLRTKRPNHKGRAKLPDTLPVDEEHIYPENYEAEKDHLVEIGREVTEELEVVPAKFYIKRYIRHKFAFKKNTNTKEGVVIGELPTRIIEKGIPNASVLSMVLRDKYFDHLPLYRQRQRFARGGIEIPPTTLET